MKKTLTRNCQSSNQGSNEMINVAYLHYQDWEEFRKQYTTAYNFLLEQSLKRELAYLEEPHCGLDSSWIQHRTKELKLILFTFGISNCKGDRP